MLGNLQTWIFDFMKTPEWLDKYNAIWFSVPAYHKVRRKNTSYDEDSQCNWNEMNEMSRYLLGVLPSLYEGETPLRVPYSLSQFSAHGH
jgi:hypothetical protein